MIVISPSPVRPRHSEIRGITVVLCAIALVAATTSCQRSVGDPRRIPVAGLVVSEGKPLELGTVLFAATEGNDAATALIRAGGKFTTTLLPGEYKVAVRSFAAGDPNAEGIVDRPPQSLIPVKYCDANTSGLTVTAAKGMEPIKLELDR